MGYSNNKLYHINFWGTIGTQILCPEREVERQRGREREIEREKERERELEREKTDRENFVE